MTKRAHVAGWSLSLLSPYIKLLNDVNPESRLDWLRFFKEFWNLSKKFQKFNFNWYTIKQDSVGSYDYWYGINNYGLPDKISSWCFNSTDELIYQSLFSTDQVQPMLGWPHRTGLRVATCHFSDQPTGGMYPTRLIMIIWEDLCISMIIPCYGLGIAEFRRWLTEQVSIISPLTTRVSHPD